MIKRLLLRVLEFFGRWWSGPEFSNPLSKFPRDPDLVTTPWTDDEVDSLNHYQACGFVHEYTSGRGFPLVATKEGWREYQGGPVVQEWAHRFSADWSWENQDSVAKWRSLDGKSTKRS